MTTTGHCEFCGSGPDCCVCGRGIVADFTEGTHPVKPAVVYQIAILFAGQWFPLSRALSRKTAEWEIREWKEKNGCHAATFRIEEHAR